MSVQLLRSTTDVNEARANIFRALGDPKRLKILQTIAESDDPRSVSEICEATGFETNVVSHHLQCLKNCQLVDAERDGRRMLYELHRDEAVEMIALADDCIRQNVESVLGCEIVTTDDG